MDSKDLELAEREFNRDRGLWADLRVRRLFWYTDLEVRLAEREFQLTLSLASISVAFLAIVFPLTPDYDAPLFKVAVPLLFLASLMGIINILWSVWFDKRAILSDLEFEDSLYAKAQKKAVENLNKALLGSLSEEDIKKYFNLKDELVAETEKRKKEKEKKIERKLLYYLHWAFFIIFGSGFVCLLLSLFTVVVGQNINS